MPTYAELEHDYLKECEQLESFMSSHRNERGEYDHGGEDIAEARRRREEIDRRAKSLEEKRGQLKDAQQDEATLSQAREALKNRAAPNRPAFNGGGGNPEPAYSDRFSPGDQVNQFLGQGGMPAVKSVGELALESKSFKEWRPGGGVQNAYVEIPISLKELFGIKTTWTSGGILTSYLRPPGVVMLGQQVPRVIDLPGHGETNSPTIRYQQENTFTNGALPVGEGLIKPEAAWDVVEKDIAIRQVAETAKYSNVTAADFPQMATYINQRLVFSVQQRVEDQVINGNGTTPNLLGFLATSGLNTITQAVSPDTAQDAIWRGLMLTRSVGFAVPDAIVMNYADWTTIRTTKTTDGLYIWGAPADAGPERIWGLPVVLTSFIAAKTVLLGAFATDSTIFSRAGVTLEMTNANEDDFRKNLICIRCETRLALIVWRPKSFAKVTVL